MEPARTIVERYNPHRLVQWYRQAHSVECSTRTSQSSPEELVCRRAHSQWREATVSGPADWHFSGLSPTLQHEYQTDACLIATLSRGEDSSREDRLESAWVWLADLHDLLSGIRQGGANPATAAVTWLKASIDVSELLLERRRADLALSLLRKAWKQATLGVSASPALRGIVLALLEPFAPVLGWSLRHHFSVPVTRLEDTIQKLMSEFSDLQIVRLQIDRGARHVIVVQKQEWLTAPLATLARQETWAARLLADPCWRLTQRGETWLLHRPLTLSKSDSSA